MLYELKLLVARLRRLNRDAAHVHWLYVGVGDQQVPQARSGLELELPSALERRDLASRVDGTLRRKGLVDHFLARLPERLPNDVLAVSARREGALQLGEAAAPGGEGEQGEEERGPHVGWRTQARGGLILN